MIFISSLKDFSKVIKLFFLQFKLEDSSATSSTTTQQPTSPTNGIAQDPLKTANISVHRKQNPTENVPNNDVKETTTTTPNRSDDDKG